MAYFCNDRVYRREKKLVLASLPLLVACVFFDSILPMIRSQVKIDPAHRPPIFCYHLKDMSTSNNNECNSNDKTPRLIDHTINKENNVIAITTPIPGSDGLVSKKTPVFQLPVYKVDLNFEQEESVTFHCDLADITDLITKLKSCENQWRRANAT